MQLFSKMKDAKFGNSSEFTHLFDNACHILLNGGFSHVDAILIQISVQVYRGYSSRVGCSHVKSRVCDVAKKY